MRKVHEVSGSMSHIIMDFRDKPYEPVIPQLKKYEIWTGYYQIDYGDAETKPRKWGEEEAINFKTACLKYELKSKLQRLEEGEAKGNLNSQDYPWWFDHNQIRNSWVGQYFETEEEAWKTFKNRN